MPVRVSAKYEVSPAFDVFINMTKKAENAVVGLGNAGPVALRKLEISAKTVFAEYARDSNQAVFANEKLIESMKNYDRTRVYAKKTYEEEAFLQRQSRREVNAMAGAFGSLESALVGLPGAWGRVGGAVVGATTAFNVGWQMGKKIDAWLKGNIQFWKEWTSTIAEVSTKLPNIKEIMKPPEREKASWKNWWGAMPEAMGGRKSDLRDPFKGTRTAEIANDVGNKMIMATKAGWDWNRMLELGVPTIDQFNKKMKEMNERLALAAVDPRSGGTRAVVAQHKGDIKDLLDLADSMHRTVDPAVLNAARSFGILSTAQEEAVARAAELKRALLSFDSAKAHVDNLKLAVEAAFAAPKTTALETKLDEAGRKAQEFKVRLEDAARAYRDTGEPKKIGLAKDLEREVAKLAARETKLRGELLEVSSEKLMSSLGDQLEKEAITAGATIDKILNGMTQSLSLIPLTGEAAIERMFKRADEITAKIKAEIEATKWEIVFQIDTTGEVDTTIMAELKAKIAALEDKLRLGGRDVGEQAKRESNYGLEKLMKVAEVFRSRVVDPLAGAFKDLISTGGRTIGKQMADAFVENLGGSIQQIMDFGMDKLFGVSRNPTTGEYMQGGKAYGTGEQGRQTALGAGQEASKTKAGVIAGATSFATGALTGYNNQQSDLSNAAGALITAAGSLASIYAALGTIPFYGWVAAAALVVGQVVGKLLQPSPSQKYSYVENLGTDRFGRFGGKPNKNIDVNTWARMVEAGQATFEASFNGWVNILMKFPNAMFKVTKDIRAVYGLFEQGSDFGRAASEKFGQEFENWIKAGFPKAIAGKFFPALAAAFESIGFSKEKFKGIWDELSLLDPAKMQEMIGVLAEAGISIQKTMAFFKMPTTGTYTGGLSYTGSQLADVQAEQQRTFAAALIISDAGIVKMAQHLDDFTGAGRINAFKELSVALEARMAQVREYLKQVGEAMVSVTKQLSDRMDEVRLSMMETATLDPATGQYSYKPDIAKQVEYLFNRLQQLGTGIQQATSPQAVQQLTTDAMTSIQRLAELGISTASNPEQRRAWQQWELDQLQLLQNASIGRLNELASAIEEVNQRLIASIEALIVAFETAVETINGEPPGGIAGDTGTGGGSGEGPPGPTYEPIVNGLGDVRTTVASGNSVLVDIRNLLKERQVINITTGNQNFEINLPGVANGGDGGGDSVGARVVRGRSA